MTAYIITNQNGVLLARSRMGRMDVGIATSSVSHHGSIWDQLVSEASRREKTVKI